ncbi:DUF2171 domain-containing protein [Novosphingobium beihaiensis]|uniref:DUF2171 domain-containing protein n=1 Tax=Novosphingobium beihaiensis TaxID=2930389 RepID=A0ABT0BSX6_9SPHN|nr:DUF2171 domain-containing protein [Novosphingobium beihaiensis]MCJ2188078.1 DUF2171 domain-containing protein [Novosphingobium beihaiensis]
MSQMQPGEEVWTTVVGTIRKGMNVIAPDGSSIGLVAGVHGGEVLFEGGDSIPLTLVDGVGEEGVLLQRRGDETFGLGAQP